MTIRQKFLKAAYPVFMWLSGKAQKNALVKNDNHKQAPVSFYSLWAVAIDGSRFNFDSLKGKKVLLVNTASDCGYTNQYEALQELFEKYNGRLVVIGFPSNDFKEQEKGDNENIARFCKINFGVNFPLMQKCSVIKNAAQHPVFEWLSHADKNGWNNAAPSWNFSKYVVDEKGILMAYAAPSVSPVSTLFTNLVEA